MAESLVEDEGTVSSGGNPESHVGFCISLGDLSLWKTNSRMLPASMAPLGVRKESPLGITGSQACGWPVGGTLV